jgi:hypothetical protein
MWHSSVILKTGIGLGMAIGATFSSAANVCMKGAEEAAVTFARWSVEDAVRTVELIQPRNLKQYRSRLQQIVDDRYSPDSAQFRNRLLGSDWTQQRIATASDQELVGRFLTGGEQLRKGWRISEVRAIESKRSYLSDREVTVSYQIETPTTTSTQRREFSAYLAGTCWVVQVPVEAWERVDRLAKILKESRLLVSAPREGPPRASLQVASASDTSRPGMRQLPRRGGASPVWVDSTALLTGEQVTSAIASWDCEAVGLGPEEPAVRLTFSTEGAAAMRRWTEANRGSMRAVIVNESVVVYARVDGVLGNKLTMCLPSAALEEAQALAADLLGAPK